MKKITFLALLVLGSVSSWAQTTVFEQNAINASGTITGYANLGTPVGIYSADDFILSGSTDIHSITVYGVQIDDNAETLLTGFSLYIYADSSGSPSGNPSVPGSGLLEIVNLSPSSTAFTLDHPGTSLYNFTVDIVEAQGTALTLSTGIYWLVVAPHGDLDASVAPLTAYWEWLFSNDINLSDAKIIDPADFYGFGLTSWFPISLIPGGNTNGKALAFTITGDNNAAVAGIDPLKQVSLFPNPVSDKLQIQVPPSIELKSVAVYDLMGKQYQFNQSIDKVLDFSRMATGVYILEIETNMGNLTKKLIKN